MESGTRGYGSIVQLAAKTFIIERVMEPTSLLHTEIVWLFAEGVRCWQRTCWLLHSSSADKGACILKHAAEFGIGHAKSIVELTG